MNHKAIGDLFIEIGTEELPAQSLAMIQKAFVKALQEAIVLAGLSVQQIHPYATPRRLALHLTGLVLKQADQIIHKQGPTKALALDAEGNWTKAALGFAASCGIAAIDLSFQKTDKGERLIVEQSIVGKSISELIGPLLTTVLAELPVGKRMRLNKGYLFSRPIHWIVLLLDDEPIQTEVCGIKSSRYSVGHRFHHPKPIIITSANQYEVILQKAFVVADFQKRRAIILEQIEKLKPENTTVCIDENLLDEVTGLVEWPVVLMGHFKKDFLKLPPEVLITAMQTHQKCFAIKDQNQNLLSQFILISNIESTNPNTVVYGNESVINARLADAAFYYEADQKISLKEYHATLKQVRFQEGLGSLFDKTERLQSLSLSIATALNASALVKRIDLKCCTEAALYCKNDFLSQMVAEFPTLQGVMGRYYGLAHGLNTIAAQAIEEHYYPRFSEDQLPSSLEGTTLAIADRVDNLVGFFGIGQLPTGSRDPFALRRQALGLLRLLIEKKISLNLAILFDQAADFYGEQKYPEAIKFIDHKHKAALVEKLLQFCFERMPILLEKRGIKSSILRDIPYEKRSNPLELYEICTKK